MGAPDQTAPPPAGSDVFGQGDNIVAGASAVILMLAISAIDKLTGYDLQLGPLHLIPVALMTWAAGRIPGFALSVTTVAIWLLIFRTAHNHPSVFYYYWDAAVLFGTLTVFVLLIARLRDALESSNARLVEVLEDLDAAVYVADPQRGEVVYGNRHFHETLDGRSYESLQPLAAKETRIRWLDGRRVVLRIIA